MEQYLELLKTIKQKGTYKPAAREGMPGTQSLFGYQFRHDLSKGFPLLTTKKMFWKGIVAELLWFLRGDTNIKYLLNHGVNIWNEDAYNFYCKLYKERHPEYLQNMFNYQEWLTLSNSNHGENIQGISNYTWGDCGYQYGKVWRGWKGEVTKVDHSCHKVFGLEYKNIDQIKNVIDSLRNTPESRRHIVTATDPAHDKQLALYWCHSMFQFNCRPISNEDRARLAVDMCILHRNEIMFDIIENPERTLQEQLDEANVPKYYLDCQSYQRSADVILGVPFNIASYALLTEIVAKMCNMIAGEVIFSYGDVHIYDNHKEALEEQLKRTPTQLPTLNIESKELQWDVIGETCNFDRVTPNDFTLSNYNPQPAIKAELSTGMKK
jgi:thymidylate synthase